MEWVVVEREFESPLTPDEVRAMAAAPGCLGLYGVEPVRSYLADGGRRMVCVFRAPDAEAVRSVMRASNSPSAKVWTGTQHRP